MIDQKWILTHVDLNIREVAVTSILGWGKVTLYVMFGPIFFSDVIYQSVLCD